jgi:uncharacterized protein YigA (DUF484 family)
MDIIEERIRSRIEAILVNDARNYAEVRMMASSDEPLEYDPFAEERNLYQRTLNSYQSAVSEVNNLLEENVGFLSGLYRMIETIKDKDDFQEICSQIVDCVLQDFGAEYCSLIFQPQSDSEFGLLYHEGIREQHKFLFSHTHATLLGSVEFAQLVTQLARETSDCVNIGDVYREARFNAIDFPSVVRALVCLPIRVRQNPVGVLVLSHSLPRFFNQNHTRALKIIASMVAHACLLSARNKTSCRDTASLQQAAGAAGNEKTLSVVLLNLEHEAYSRQPLKDRALIDSIRSRLSRTLGDKDSMLLYEGNGLLMLLPGISEEQMPLRAARVRAAYEEWRAGQGDTGRDVHLGLGYSTCESGEDLTQTLQVASMLMRANQDDEHDSQPVQSSPLS